MNAQVLSELLLRSLAIGAAAWICVRLCPASWRGRARRVVPVAAFSALLLLGATLLLPKHEIPLPVALAGLEKASAWTPGMWVAGLWLAGTVICIARLLLDARAVHLLLRTTHSLPGRSWKNLLADCQRTLGMSGKVSLRRAGPGFVPSATGLFHRVVLLPDEALEWTPAQRRLVLLHELGHFHRGDLWTHALGRLACALHWFNPFVWILARHLAVEREFACDELVVSRGAAPHDYATLLFNMAGAMQRQPTSAAAFLAMASPRSGKLEARVQRILSPARKAGILDRALDTTLLASLAALLVLCTACKPMLRSARSLLPQKAWTPAEVQARLAADPFPGN